MSMRAHGLLGAAILGVGLLGAAVGSGPSLENVEVLGAGAGARIVLDVDGAVTHKSFRLSQPDRLVVDLVGATNGVRAATRSFETGPVARVRVSQFKGAPDPVTRVVADLREVVEYRVETQDEDLVLVVGKAAVGAPEVGVVPAAVADPAVPFVPAAETPAPVAETVVQPAPVQDPPAVVGMTPVNDATPLEPTVASPAETVVPAAATAVETETAPAAAATPRAQVTSGASIWQEETAATPLEDTSPDTPGALEMQSGGGRRINLDVQGADIHTVLRTLSDYSGKNIIASRDVEGSVTARLFDTPWQDALGSVLKAHGYGYVEENGIIRVGVLTKIRSEELEAAAAERKREDLLPIETQVVRMQFADATELKPSLSDMLSQRGKLQVDARTNALIVSDIPDYVAKIAAMARDLDSRTPQVEIVSKLVDVSAEDSRNLGIDWEALNLRPSGSPVTGSATVTAPTTGAVGQLRLGSVQSWGQLDAVLDALAKAKKANIVSNPNITTVNNREAKILVGAKIPLIVADQAGNAITQLTTIGIQMRVTPHINSDKTITMDLHPEVSELSSQATVQGGVIIQTSEADTRVLVDNNETAIIGGLVRNVESETRTGVPVLQDVPLLGALFRNTNKTHDKRELIIFVTPRIIEPGTLPQGNRGGDQG
jgi:type IV pilus assembly protein PilQ